MLEAPLEESPEATPPASSRSPLAKEVQANLARFPHCLLLTRVGSFYESYFGQANEIASLLNIKLTSRKWDGSRVPMCGFPIVHLDKYLKVLVQQHKRSVAMCEEFPRQTEFGEKEFERRITRIISPGTLIDEPFLEPSENNFLLALALPLDGGASSVGLAWIDVSTGEFYSKDCQPENLEDEIVRINPKEVVLPSTMRTVDISRNPVLVMLQQQNIHFAFHGVEQHPDVVSMLPFTPTPASASAEGEAVALLSNYLHFTLLEHAPSLGAPVHEMDNGRLHIDAHTIKSLELRETDYEGGTRGSLLNVIKRTVTTSGTRRLARRLCSPSASRPEIEGWQNLVSFLLQRPHLSFDLRESLKNVGDVGRIVQRFLLRKGSIDDLVTVMKTIQLWTTITSRLQLERLLEGRGALGDWSSMDPMLGRISDLSSLSRRIQDALTRCGSREADGDPEDSLKESTGSSRDTQANSEWTINPQFSPKLFSLYATLHDLQRQKQDMEDRLRINYAAPSLTLRSSAQQGMHVHLSRAKRDQGKLNDDPAFVKLAETASTKCYLYQPWSQLGGLIGSTMLAVAAAEREAFSELIAEVLYYADELKANVAAQDDLDVALGFATLAKDLNLVRPKITENGEYHVVNGRHPAVELGLLVSGRTFTPNTIEMTPSSNVHVITGPNMAGKSTALRQTALIAVLAQIGSFVPADSATISIVDKLFTRIGAKDDLFRDRSTFMVEMMETAEILRRATPNSLVIMDEVGRGTTMKDGLAIAFATIHHIATVNRSRCLFATHFHELSDMLGCDGEWQGSGVFNNVRFYCTDVDELDEDRFVYSYRLHPGVNRDSHGLKVAQLAGLPPSAIDVARRTLSWLNHSRAIHQEPDAASLSNILQMKPRP
ncbi:MutS2 protein [Coprinopsis cinerea okayama7|uniref:MutS2 protein n=1 Tax=Coprinopsis cinerea (strain Okayama-7 / 130 / ATCC MYA-4618 / FGSC 9003) TaxID=240176 RepID=A8N209_COPC7|nr:MutS2 protein [Coprinopsis cinerea okayama7\|eukprot:XP_001828908.2 MutS2 protein [Coprinopsis cinerea okayama7\